MSNFDLKHTRVDVDCSILEGGGQIFRNSLAYASILNVETILAKIRHNRPNPGLSAQHFLISQIFTRYTNATIVGSAIRSTELHFSPQNHNIPLNDNFDVGTAGAISLVVQAILPFLLCRDIFQIHNNASRICEISLKGGTNVSHSPPLDHLLHVVLPILNRDERIIDVNVVRRGYYPEGGGIVSLRAGQLSRGWNLNATTQPNAISRANCIIFGRGAQYLDMAESLSTILPDAIIAFLNEKPYYSGQITGDKVHVEITRDGSRSKKGDAQANRDGNKSTKGKNNRHESFGCQLWLTTDTGIPLSANVLLDSKDMNILTCEAVAQQLMHQIAWILDAGACIDEHTADQLIIFMALTSAAQKLAEVQSGSTQPNPRPSVSDTSLCDSAGCREGAAMEDPESVQFVSRMLCAPRIEEDLFFVNNELVPMSQLSPAEITQVPLALRQSSLHLEAAIEIAKAFTGCRISIEEVGERKARLVTVAPPINIPEWIR